MLSTRFKRASATLLPLLCLLITFWTPSTLTQDLPQRATVQRALDALGKSDTPTASQQADQKFLTDTLSLLDSIDKETATALDDNGDPAVRGVIDDLAGTLARADMVDLIRRAEATPTPEDDRIVKRLRQIERDLIQHAIEVYAGHMSEIARRLGIGRSTLYRKVREQGLEEQVREAG